MAQLMAQMKAHLLDSEGTVNGTDKGWLDLEGTTDGTGESPLDLDGTVLTWKAQWMRQMMVCLIWLVLLI
jgi:hypothetical protein